MPSTSSFSTWLPGNGSCHFANPPTSQIPTDPEECAVQRGVGLYNGQQSTGYVGGLSGSYQELATQYLGLGAQLDPLTLFGTDYNISALSGLDVVSVQHTNNSWTPPLQETPIFSIQSLYYGLPILGLGFGQWKSGTGGASIPSFMSVMANSSEIPSRSWGYTAGAYYGECLVPCSSCSYREQIATDWMIADSSC